MASLSCRRGCPPARAKPGKDIYGGYSQEAETAQGSGVVEEVREVTTEERREILMEKQRKYLAQHVDFNA